MINRCTPLQFAVKSLLLYSVCYRAFNFTIMNLFDYLKDKGFLNLIGQDSMKASHAGSSMTYEELFDGYLEWNKPKTFEQASEPMMKFLAENHHPHTMAQIESNRAILWEGLNTHHNDEFLVD